VRPNLYTPRAQIDKGRKMRVKCPICGKWGSLAPQRIGGKTYWRIHHSEYVGGKRIRPACTVTEEQAKELMKKAEEWQKELEKLEAKIWG